MTLDEARARHRLPAEDERPVDEAELFTVVGQAARRGNLQAQRLAWEMLKERRAERGIDDVLNGILGAQFDDTPLSQRELEAQKQENRNAR